jgi:hypothetical protein
MTRNNVVLVRPDFEVATWHGSFFTLYHLKPVIEKLQLTYSDLYKEKCVKSNFDPLLNDLCLLISGVGHGNPTKFTGQNYAVLLNAENPKDVEKMRNMAISALSCEFGQSVKTWINGGCSMFHGYDRTYYFIRGTPARDDATANMFFDSHFKFDKVWLEEAVKGNNAWEKAHTESQKRYEFMIQSTPDPTVKHYLTWDMESMVTAGPTAPPPQPNAWCRFLLWLLKVSKCPIS